MIFLVNVTLWVVYVVIKEFKNIYRYVYRYTAAWRHAISWPAMLWVVPTLPTLYAKWPRGTLWVVMHTVLYIQPPTIDHTVTVTKVTIVWLAMLWALPTLPTYVA